MNKDLQKAIEDVIDAFEVPDSPEAFVFAMYYLKMIYEREMKTKNNKKPRAKRL
jgi:hypothetical protein